jgi:hypothetical protein
MKRAWDPAVLSVLWWRGPEPSVGDVLETSTGRRYLTECHGVNVEQLAREQLEAFILYARENLKMIYPH